MSFYFSPTEDTLAMREFTRLVCRVLKKKLGRDSVMCHDGHWLTVTTGTVLGRETRFKVGFVKNEMWLTDAFDYDNGGQRFNRVSCREHFELIDPSVDPVEIVCERVKRVKKRLKKREVTV